MCVRVSDMETTYDYLINRLATVTAFILKCEADTAHGYARYVRLCRLHSHIQAQIMEKVTK